MNYKIKIGQIISEYTVEQLFQMPSFSRTSKNSHLARQFTEFTTGERFERRYCSLCHICVIIIIICSNMCPIRDSTPSESNDSFKCWSQSSQSSQRNCEQLALLSAKEDFSEKTPNIQSGNVRPKRRELFETKSND